MSIMASLRAMESRPGIWCGSVALGFPYADAPHLGASVLMYANDPDCARRSADSLAEEIWSRREEFDISLVAPDEAVAEAVGHPQWPVVLVDPADNVGGGSAGDGTVILEALLRHGAKDAVIVIADPEAVEVAVAAGEGGAFEAPVGAKVDDRHGAPVPVRGIVTRLGDGRYVHKGSYMTGYETSMGRCAVVDARGHPHPAHLAAHHALRCRASALHGTRASRAANHRGQVRKRLARRFRVGGPAHHLRGHPGSVRLQP